jgi:hypothetical protein
MTDSVHTYNKSGANTFIEELRCTKIKTSTSAIVCISNALYIKLLITIRSLHNGKIH